MRIVKYTHYVGKMNFIIVLLLMQTWGSKTNKTGSTTLKEWTTPDSRNTPSTTNLEEEEIVDAPGNDGNASMPEQVKRSNPWRMMMMMMILYPFPPPAQNTVNFSLTVNTLTELPYCSVWLWWVADPSTYSFRNDTTGRSDRYWVFLVIEPHGCRNDLTVDGGKW